MNSSRKRLGYVCLQATREGQASHAHVHEIIAGLKRRHWEVQLFEPSYAGEGGGPLPGPLGRLQEFARVQFAALRRMRALDVLYVRGHFATWPVTMVAARAGVKVVYEVNGPYADAYLSWPGLRRVAPIIEWLVRQQLRVADAVIAVTPGLKQWVEREAPTTHVRVIPNGANTDMFAPGARCTRWLPQRYVAFVGALAPWQGISTMVEAVLDSAWPADIRLVLVGDGAERELVQKASAASDRISYLGKLPYTEIPGILSQSMAALSVQTDSAGRGSTGLSPLKVYEALACGVPAIVSDFPGQSDVVRQHDCGVVIPPSSPASLAAAVAQLASDDALRSRLADNARAAVVLHHSWSRRAGQTDELLRSLVSPSHAIS